MTDRLAEIKARAERLFLFSLEEELTSDEADVMAEGSKDLKYLLDAITSLQQQLGEATGRMETDAKVIAELRAAIRALTDAGAG